MNLVLFCQLFPNYIIFSMLQDQSQKARQGSDNNFERVPYGETVYTGGCVREREDVVARAFQLCVLVEGNIYI